MKSFRMRLLNSLAILALVAAFPVVSAPAASAANLWPPDPALYCWNNKPFQLQQSALGWTLYWRSPQISQRSSTRTTCNWWIRQGNGGWILPYDQTVDWSSACRQQYGSRSTYVFAPGWRYNAACNWRR